MIKDQHRYMGCINRPGDAVAVTIALVLDCIPASQTMLTDHVLSQSALEGSHKAATSFLP
jgi:hypothetical protein